MTPWYRRLTFAKLRTPILFVSGLIGLGYETIQGGAEKPTLIIAFVGMMGLPVFIKKDEDPPPPPPVEPPPAPHPRPHPRPPT